MKLTAEQKTILAQRIAGEFKAWMVEETEYQIDNMKDNDELDWNYYLDPADNMKVLRLVQKLVAEDLGVPVE